MKSQPLAPTTYLKSSRYRPRPTAVASSSNRMFNPRALTSRKAKTAISDLSHAAHTLKSFPSLSKPLHPSHHAYMNPPQSMPSPFDAHSNQDSSASNPSYPSGLSIIAFDTSLYSSSLISSIFNQAQMSARVVITGLKQSLGYWSLSAARYLGTNDGASVLRVLGIKFSWLWLESSTNRSWQGPLWDFMDARSCWFACLVNWDFGWGLSTHRVF